MKKTIVSMMVAIALMAGGSVYAQAQSDGNTGATVQKEKCENCKGDKDGKNKKGKDKGKKGDKKGDKKDGRKASTDMKKQRPQFNPFEGIQLTADQQQKLQVLQQGLGPVQLTKEQQAKIPENKDLTPEQKKQLREERETRKLEAKKNYLSGVKETLTPEQYVIFLENAYLYAPQNQGKDSGMRLSAPKFSKTGDRGSKDRKVKEVKVKPQSTANK